MTHILDKNDCRESLVTTSPLQRDAPATDFYSDTGSSPDPHAGRLQQLEAENRRLLLLVAELLIKNQELRKTGASRDKVYPASH